MFPCKILWVYFGVGLYLEFYSNCINISSLFFEKKNCIARAHFHPTWFPISIFFVFQGVKGPANGNQRYCDIIQALIILSY